MRGCGSLRNSASRVVALLKKDLWLLLIFGVAVAVAFVRIHIRNRTTILSYEIGRLKKRELILLERRSHLKMRLARITSKEHLQVLAE